MVGKRWLVMLSDCVLAVVLATVIGLIAFIPAVLVGAWWFVTEPIRWWRVTRGGER